MKKKLVLLIFFLLCTTLFSCKKNSSETKPDISNRNSTSSTQTIGNINPLTGLYDLAQGAVGKRPISIMVSNISTVKNHQYGLSKADICFETLAEGGITRIEAVFADTNAIQKTGPVRSVREYYVDFVAPYSPIFVHWGGSPTGYSNLANSGLQTIDGMQHGDSFITDSYIEQTSGKEHSQFIDSEIINNLCRSLSYDTAYSLSAAFDFMTEAEISNFSISDQAKHVTIPFSDSAVSTFTLNETTQKYEKGQFGQPQTDANTGEVLSVDNVFVLFTSIVSTNDDAGRMKVSLVGGQGYYIAKGNLTSITWTKGDSSFPFVLKGENGETLKVLPGRSWIAVVPVEKKSILTFE